MTSKLHEFRLSLLGKDISPVQSAKDLGCKCFLNLIIFNCVVISYFSNLNNCS